MLNTVYANKVSVHCIDRKVDGKASNENGNM